MTILHLDSGREMRGGQYQALALIEGLRAAGHEVRVLAHPGMPFFARAAAEPLTLRAIHAASLKADLVHAHDSRSHTFAAISARAPLVVARRVAFPAGRSFAARWKYGRAARFLAVSRFVAGELERAGVPSERISVVYDGVDLPAAVRPRDGDRIVALRSEDPLKANDLLDATGLPIAYSTDLPRDLPGAAVFVYLSRSEGLGSAALLAMAHGVPVVASRTGGLPEAVDDGRTGLLTANDPAAVRAAVLRLRDDRTFAAACAAQAHERAARLFSTSTMVEATLAAYRKVLAR